jgi:hypothetical protein
MNLKDDQKAFYKTLKKLSKKDFNGHSNFNNISLEERLEWLSQVAQFNYIIKKNIKKKNKKV